MLAYCDVRGHLGAWTVLGDGCHFEHRTTGEKVPVTKAWLREFYHELRGVAEKAHGFYKRYKEEYEGNTADIG